MWLRADANACALAGVRAAASTEVRVENAHLRAFREIARLGQLPVELRSPLVLPLLLDRVLPQPVRMAHIGRRQQLGLGD